MDFTHELTSAGWYLGALAILFLLRRLLGVFWSVTAFVVVSLIYLKAGFDPAMPDSLFVMFVGIMLAAVLLYVTSSRESVEGFFGPIRRRMVANDLLSIAVVGAFLVAVPVVVAMQAYRASLPSNAAPPKIRSIHPSPPSTITFTPVGGAEGHVVDIITGLNPYRELEETDPVGYERMIARGKVVYYENCFYCHGDTLNGDGHYADAFTPVPAKFQAKDTIPMLTDAYVFWRVAKGGPGLPSEGTPWDSTMPVWEDFLTEEDIWASTMFLYDYTGYQPRAQEAGDH